VRENRNVSSGRLWVVTWIVLFVAQVCRADEWPQWRGLHRNSLSREAIATNWSAAGPKVIWTASVGTGFSGVSVASGRACTMGNTNGQDTVWCFDAAKGRPLWHHTYSAQLSPQWYEGGPGATPTIDRDHVFTISKWGDVFCFDLAIGSIVWQRNLRQDGLKPNRWGFAGSPLVWRDLVILNAGSAGVALNRQDGRIVWSNGTNATGYASPTLFAPGSSESVLIFAAQHLVALDPRTGAERWRYFWKTDWDTNNSDPTVDGDRIFISSFSRGCALLSVTNAEPALVYENKVICNNLSPGVLLGPYYYVFSGEAKKETELRCIELRTGQLKWATRDPGFGSLLCAAGDLVVLSEKGELLVFAKSPARASQTGDSDFLLKPEAVARANVLSGTCWTQPSLANGRLYVRNAKGELRCLDVSGKDS
jgi:outer membrane protein assembly factor BamB